MMKHPQESTASWSLICHSTRSDMALLAGSLAIISCSAPVGTEGGTEQVGATESATTADGVAEWDKTANSSNGFVASGRIGSTPNSQGKIDGRLWAQSGSPRFATVTGFAKNFRISMLVFCRATQHSPDLGVFRVTHVVNPGSSWSHTENCGIPPLTQNSTEATIFTDACITPICVANSQFFPGDPNCDPCVNTICNTGGGGLAPDSYCCAVDWDSQCVSEVGTMCGEKCDVH